MIKVNATGQTCPIPVIMTKNALKNITEGIVEVSIDNKISKENIEKFSKEMGFSSITREENGVFFVTITKTIAVEEIVVDSKNEDNVVFVISSDKMGEGDSTLGETLMKGFIYTLTEMEVLPKAILFYNRGVFLTASNEVTIKDLKILEERGVEILSCGACLNFYSLEGNLSVGSPTNMYNIIDKQMKASRVIKP
ncbi:sulfurtransferase-like selenium metabolism protein YedF [Candidatus Cetobacterium colombiensis]|uniref:Sulfurtransferase-like selenium metabolism protein YedF n=1 Tax=Candidatus Cetobacterium colombiensis TaxID=3073100 RepID=A0ABU4W7P6_9FUSO|nr:sulfurtransferase-like selenium metabolism protein YedF [Candidatus Cetobacterium colombiensis]MDX8335548.1 sulfurtransferase-like selenium metabolism protein YedF [Candidatus Cetobacterium colombiensis]